MTITSLLTIDKMKLKALLFILVLSAYTFQDKYKIGDKINDFSLTNAVDNNKVSLSDYSKSKAVAIVFTSNECPYSKLYENRLLEMVKEFNEKNVKFIFINSNNPGSSPEDRQQEMTRKAADKKFTFPYLVDNRQEVSNLFGATKTPEVFVLKNINGNLILKYKGAIDDNPQTETDVNHYYLKDVLSAIINDAAPKVQQTRAIGCVIKK
jgi:peroxiredoxin